MDPLDIIDVAGSIPVVPVPEGSQPHFDSLYSPVEWFRGAFTDSIAHGFSIPFENPISQTIYRETAFTLRTAWDSDFLRAGDSFFGLVDLSPDSWERMPFSEITQGPAGRERWSSLFEDSRSAFGSLIVLPPPGFAGGDGIVPVNPEVLSGPVVSSPSPRPLGFLRDVTGGVSLTAYGGQYGSQDSISQSLSEPWRYAYRQSRRRRSPAHGSRRLGRR